MPLVLCEHTVLILNVLPLFPFLTSQHEENLIITFLSYSLSVYIVLINAWQTWLFLCEHVAMWIKTLRG